MPDYQDVPRPYVFIRYGRSPDSWVIAVCAFPDIPVAFAPNSPITVAGAVLAELCMRVFQIPFSSLLYAGHHTFARLGFFIGPVNVQKRGENTLLLQSQQVSIF